jgi:hypothetical protein
MAAVKRKRTVLTVEQKIDICKRLKKGASITSVSKGLGVGKSTICDIRKSEDKLMEFVSKMEHTEGSLKRRTVKKATDSSLDDALYLWFTQKRSQGIPVSGPILMAKALELNKELHPGDQNFKASQGWLSKFQSRHGIRQLAIQGEKMSANKEVVESFKLNICQLIEEEGLALSQVYNCDETGLYWKALPSKTLASHNEKTAPGYKVSKERVTILACANCTGDHKLRLTLIGKAQNPRALKNVSRNALPVRYSSHKSAWMTSQLFQQWFFEEFIPSTKKYLQTRNLPIRALLLLDNAPSHPSTSILQSEDGNFKCVFLPPNTTSLIQPMDQGVLESTKRRYRKELLKKLLLADTSTPSISNPALAIVDYWKKLTIKDAIFMVANAWNDVPQTTIAASWKQLLSQSITCDTPVEESVTIPELKQALGAIQGCEDSDEADIAEWIQLDANDLGYQILNDDEILQVVKGGKSEEDDIDQDSEEQSAESLPSHSEVSDMLCKCLPWVEAQSETTATHLFVFRNLMDLAARKRMSSLKQTKITSFFS